MPTALTPALSLQYRRVLRILYGLCLLLVAGFSVYYLTHSHAYLAGWFRNLNPCFYRSTFWERDFFTPAVKAHGNILCCIAIGVCALMSGQLFRSRKGVLPVAHDIRLSRTDILYLAALLTAGSAMWRFAHRHILPYMDEVFSAVHCADKPAFQTYAYYMLPNNHILYNVMNGLFFPSATDHVLTGRIISGATLLCLLPVLYLWSRQLLGQRLPALLITLAIVVHFQVWGFAAMGRGYALCLLCEWLAFAGLWQYLRQGDRRWLRLMALAVLFGFATLPTYLYFFISLILIAALWQCYCRRIDLALIRYSALALAGVFLFYLPALCFSGVHAFLANEYVLPKAGSTLDFLPMAFEQMRETLVYSFTGYYTKTEDYYLVLAAIPLLNFCLYRNKRHLFLGTFYILLWLSVLMLSIVMRQYPFQRNLIGQINFSYAFLLLTTALFLQRLLSRLRRQRLFQPVLATFLLLFLYHYGKIARDRLALSIYHFDINRYGELLAMDLRDLPPKADVAFSDESFYLLYLSRKRGFGISECGDGSQEYYIKIDGEILPDPPHGHYQLMWERGDYRIYQRKDH